ncbi:hypothetical protein [Methylobacterium iners]|uniref:Uncharacterized protein n=1 Tax=Methylobacterium iners TaxID=418707 RepID=A0ABQ4RUJ4_9HYPH|nr:hypothetical protein [Methylobacterium iners]GJD93838.1 hypothetical protein OCOJLMKI_1036 [Methylobacterium iners]
MKTSFRIALFTTTALAALGAAPTRGADGMLAREATPAPLSGAERWRLRPAEVTTTGATAKRPGKAGQASEIPEARRAVRMVYPGLTAAR